MSLFVAVVVLAIAVVVFVVVVFAVVVLVVVGRFAYLYVGLLLCFVIRMKILFYM